MRPVALEITAGDFALAAAHRFPTPCFAVVRRRTDGAQFIAGATGASTDTVAHAAILTIAAVPDVLAVLLLVAAGYVTPKAPVVRRRMVRRRKLPRPPLRPVPALRVAAAA
jgi:hypothetical protein